MRTVLLVNFLPPYRISALEELAKRVDLRILLSVAMEENRQWDLSWGSLQVVVQRTLTFRMRWRHPSGFSESGYIHFPWSTIRDLRRERPAVIVSSEFGLRSIQAALYCLLNPSVYFVIWATLSERTEMGRGPFRRSVRRFLVRTANVIIVNGASGRRYVAGLGARDQSLVVIPQIATPFFRVLNGTENIAHDVESVSRWLFVGQLIERKGLSAFLEAVRGKVDLDNVRLTVVGDGTERVKILEAANGCGMEIAFIGHLAPDQVREIYLEADVLLMPSLADEWGLVVNEALAAGLPILGSIHAQAVEDLVIDGVNGWTFDADDSDSMVNACRKASTVRRSDLLRMQCNAVETAASLTPSEWANMFVSAISPKSGSRDS